MNGRILKITICESNKSSSSWNISVTLCLTLLLINHSIKTLVNKLRVLSSLPLVDELGHLLLHLFALQLLLQENLEARHRVRPLGVFLVGL